MLKKITIWKILGGLVSLLLLACILLCMLVYLNRNKIASTVKEEINNNIHGHFDFSNAGLSLRHFPALGICLDKFSIVGVEPFDGDTLIAGDRLDFSVSLKFLWKADKAIEIKYLTLTSPLVQILIDENGIANYDIIKTTTPDSLDADTTGYAFDIALQSYELNDADVRYADKSSGVILELFDVLHKGKGNFTEAIFDLDMTTEAGRVNFLYASISYLKDVNIKVNNILHVNLDENTYAFQAAEAHLNALNLELNGTVQVGDTLTYRIDFRAPGNAFKDLFSVIPYAYTENFKSVQAEGNFSLEGQIGQQFDAAFPDFSVDARITDGAFQYPELPAGMTNIQLTAAVSNPGTSADATLIDVARLDWILGGESFTSRFMLRNLVSDPSFDGMARGTIDLAAFSNAFPMEGVETLAGLLRIDAQGKGRISQIERGEYENLDLSAQVEVDNVIYHASGQPVLHVAGASMQLDPQFLKIESLNAKYGKSDIDMTGQLRNGLLLLTGRGKISGTASLRSGMLDVNELMGWDVEDQSSAEASVAKADEQPIDPMYSELELDLDAVVDTLIYDVYTLYNSSAEGFIRGQEVIIERFKSTYNNEEITGAGKLGNIWNYRFLDGTLTGELIVETEAFDLNPFLPADDTAGQEGEEVEPILVPTVYDIDIQAKAGSVIFQNFNLNDLNGTIRVRDGIAELIGIQSGFLGGAITLNGAYDTRDPAQPFIRIDYNLQNLDFGETFRAVKTFAVLAPVAQFIEGKFNSTLSLESALTPDFSPRLSTINAEGLLQTMTGEIREFPPFEKAAALMQFDFLKRIPIEGSKNKFRVVDGTVFVDPFDIHYQDVTMTISGQHKIEEGMDYQMLIELPYQKIRDKIGAGQAMASVAEQAAKLGINLREGVRINLLVNLTGTIRDPNVDFRLLSDVEENLMESIKEQIDSKVDSLKTEARERIDSAKAVIEEEIDAKKEELEQKINQEITALKARAQATAGQIRSQARSLAEKVRSEGYAQADKLVEAAGDDPYKQLAAKKTAERMRKETDKRVEEILEKAETEAQQVLVNAEAKADSLRQSIP